MAYGSFRNCPRQNHGMAGNSEAGGFVNSAVTCTYLCLLLPFGNTISSHGLEQIVPPLLLSGDSFNCLFLLIHNLKYKQYPRLTTLESSQFASSCAIFEILQCLSENIYIPVAQLVTSLPAVENPVEVVESYTELGVKSQLPLSATYFQVR